jgi:DNA-binding IclR family transcriptional regulator
MMIKSLEKGLRILCYLATKSKTGPSEISRELKYGKSTVVRLLQTMEALSFVEQDRDTGRYELGPRVLELAHNFLVRQDGLVSLAMDQIQALWSKYGETVGLNVREGDARICIYRLESPRSLRHSVRVGQVLPLHLGASGKTFMAYMRPDEVETLLVRENVAPDRASRLRHELPEIKQKGIAYSFGEREQGTAGVAAPILNGRREPVAVMFISGPLQRFTPALIQEMAEALAVAAQTISSRVVA